MLNCLQQQQLLVSTLQFVHRDMQLVFVIPVHNGCMPKVCMGNTVTNNSYGIVQKYIISCATLCPIKHFTCGDFKMTKINLPLIILVLGADPETLTAQPKASHITPGELLPILVTLRILPTSSCGFHDLICIFLICR